MNGEQHNNKDRLDEKVRDMRVRYWAVGGFEIEGSEGGRMIFF